MGNAQGCLRPRESPVGAPKAARKSAEHPAGTADLTGTIKASEGSGPNGADLEEKLAQVDKQAPLSLTATGCSSDQVAPCAEVAPNCGMAPEAGGAIGTLENLWQATPAFALGFCATDDSDQLPEGTTPEESAPVGGPHVPFHLGAPAPLTDDRGELQVVGSYFQRYVQPDYVKAPPDPDVEHILQLVRNIYRTQTALVALFNNKRVAIINSSGLIQRGEFPWRWSPCGWSLVARHPQAVVIPDVTRDARFSDNQILKGAGIRFYAGTPLVASNGMRLGILCFTGPTPRDFDASSCQMLVNLSEMVVRSLERDIKLEEVKQVTAKQVELKGSLSRSLDVLEQCILLVDATVPGCQVLYANRCWSSLTGLPGSHIVGHLLSEVFERPDDLASVVWPEPGALDGVEFDKADEAGGGFSLRQELEVEGVELKQGSVRKPFCLTFRAATETAVDILALPIGVPSFLQRRDQPHSSASSTVSTRIAPAKVSEADAASATCAAHPGYYFVTVKVERSFISSHAAIDLSSMSGPSWDIHSPCSSSSSGSWTTRYFPQDPSFLQGLKLGPLLGCGSSGHVYRGELYGSEVAVKVIGELLGEGGVSVKRPSQALLSRHLKHPNIVHMLQHSEVLLRSGVQPKAVKQHAANMAQLQRQQAQQQQAQELQPQVVQPGFAIIEYVEGLTEGVSLPSAAALPAEPAVAAAKGVTEAKRDPSERSETWMVLEYCDNGCLRDAVDQGWLRDKRSCISGVTNMAALHATAMEVASAMAYLHEEGVLHGDLSGFSVLLTTSGANASAGGRGFVAKLADFGLACAADPKRDDGGVVVQINLQGNISHLAPELLSEGVLTQAADSYAFGVLLWEMYCGSRPWAGMCNSQIHQAVAEEKRHLKFPADTPAWVRQLARSCLVADRQLRPSFSSILEALSKAL